MFGQPASDGVAVASDREEAVAAARADDDGLSGRLVRRCGIDEEFGVDRVVEVAVFLFLGACILVGVGCRGVVPQFDHLDLGGGGQRRREGDERQQSFHGYRGLEVGF